MNVALDEQLNNQKSSGIGINQLCKQAFETAKSKGWHDEPRETGTLLALIHSEVSEALEADRKGDAENFVEELADVCIRIFDLCGAKEIDLEAAILKKMERNKGRSYKHGGKAY
jgi:NTP pyrophosphatase (non-canonical NTP hydrolase)